MIYILFVGLRFMITITQRSYIHPDEFFQGPQVITNLLMGGTINEKYLPWEFVDCPPNRSIVPPFIFFASPLLLLRHLFRIQLTDKILLIVPRISVFLSSLLIGESSIFQFIFF